MDFNWDRKKKGKGVELGSFVTLSRGWNRVTAFLRRKKPPELNDSMQSCRQSQQTIKSHTEGQCNPAGKVNKL